jgi:hypothetical protein
VKQLLIAAALVAAPVQHYFFRWPAILTPGKLHQANNRHASKLKRVINSVLHDEWKVLTG